MKRLLVSACAIAALTFAPQAHAAGLTAGLKGGVNWAKIGGDGAPDNVSSRTGFSGGGFLRHNMNEQFGVQAEVLYVQKGFEGDIHTVDGDIHPGKARLDYVDVPIELVGRFKGTDKIALEVFAGPSFNFNIKAEAETEDGFENDDGRTKNFEFGAVVGGGIEYMLSSFSILADVRYSLGATSIAEDVAGQSVDVKNRGIAVMGGISFPLGSK
jgi:hypothetical protein